MAAIPTMKSVAVFLLRGEVTADDRLKTVEALKNRGFDVFAVKPLRDSSDSAWFGGIPKDSLAFITFNSLMSGDARDGNSVFADREVGKAVQLLCHTLENAPDRLRATIDSSQAAALVKELLSDDEMQELERSIAGQRKQMSTDIPILADLSRFKYRAKVELVEWNGETAVKKTFRPSAKDAMARELAFCDDMAPHSSVPARILSRDATSIMYEYIENSFKTRRILGLRMPLPLPLARVRELAEFVHVAAQRGWDPIDLTPRDNVLIDARSGRLRAIDFEFAHRRASPVAPEKAYFLSGVPPEATASCPLNNDMEKDPYPSKWRPFTALSKTSFLYDPVFLQRAKRLVIHPFWLAAFVFRAVWRRRHHAAGRDRLLEAVALRDSLPSKDAPHR